MLRSIVSVALIIALSSMPCLLAQSQVVARQDLHQAVKDSAGARQEKIQRIQEFFSSERVQQVISSSDIDFRQVQEAAPFLTAQELSQLEARVAQVEEEIVGGALTNQEITYILIALATAVIVLIIVAD